MAAAKKTAAAKATRDSVAAIERELSALSAEMQERFSVLHDRLAKAKAAESPEG